MTPYGKVRKSYYLLDDRDHAFIEATLKAAKEEIVFLTDSERSDRAYPRRIDTALACLKKMKRVHRINAYATVSVET